MPLAAAASAWASYHAPAWLASEWLLRGLAAPFALALGLVLGGVPAALAAAALACLPGVSPFGAEFAQSGYTPLVLLAAAALARRAEAPGRASATALGLAVGASLLFRSPLVFLPPLLAAWEHRRRRPWAEVLLVGLLPYALLAPWAALSGSLVERREASANVVTGALGLVSTIEGDWRDLAEGPADSELSSALAWGAREAARHPLRTAAAVLRRGAAALAAAPLLWLAAAAALWAGRDRPAFRALAAFLLYFVGAHCLMSVRAEFFIPLRPLLAALAAAAALRRLRPAAAEHAAAGAVLAALLLPVLLMAAAALRAAAAYPSASRRPDALERALAAHPRDAWLLARRGRRALLSGDAAGAARDLRAAAALRPADPGLALGAAWAALRAGDGAALGALDEAADAGMNPASAASARRREAADPHLAFEARLLKAAALLRAGDATAAAGLRGALGYWDEEVAGVTRPAGERDRAAHAALRRGAGAAAPLAAALEAWLPLPERLDLLARADALVPERAALWSRAAREVTPLLPCADYPAALAALGPAARHRAGAKLLSDHGVCLGRAGARAEARRAFAAALALDPGLEDAKRSLAALDQERR